MTKTKLKNSKIYLHLVNNYDPMEVNYGSIYNDEMND